MSTFRTSRGTRGQHVDPRHASVYTPSPARREHIHGPIQPMEQPRDNLRLWVALALASPFLAAIVSGAGQW